MDHEFSGANERIRQYEATAFDIEGRIKIFAQRTHQPFFKNIDYIVGQVLPREAITGNGRRDAYQILRAVTATQRNLNKARTQIEILGYNPFDFDPSKHQISPETVNIMMEQIIYNWRTINPAYVSPVTLRNLAAAAERTFYVDFHNSSDKSRDEQLDTLWNLLPTITQAVEKNMWYRPITMEDIVNFGPFMQQITYKGESVSD